MTRIFKVGPPQIGRTWDNTVRNPGQEAQYIINVTPFKGRTQEQQAGGRVFLLLLPAPASCSCFLLLLLLPAPASCSCPCAVICGYSLWLGNDKRFAWGNDR